MKQKRSIMGKNKSDVKTVGIILPFLLSRGTEKQALNLCKGFLDKGFKVILFNVQGWGDFAESFIKSGIDVVNVGPPSFKNIRCVSKNRLFRLAYLVKKYKCDCILSRAKRTNQIASIAARINFIPSIVVISNRIKKPDLIIQKNFLKQKTRLFKFLLKNGFADYFVTVSKEGAENLVATFPSLSKRVFPIQNGVNIDDINNQLIHAPVIGSSNKFRLCFAGSIEFKRKGVDTLLNVIKELIHIRGHEDIELLIIGSGDDEIKSIKNIKENKLEKNVIFLGEQANPYPLIKSSDLFILPSRYEGMPNVLLEAMALEVCSIAFDCDTGPREIIENKKNGILIPQDDKDRLIEAILWLKENKDIREKLARSGKNTVKEKFTFDLMIDDYMRLLRKIFFS